MATSKATPKGTVKDFDDAVNEHKAVTEAKQTAPPASFDELCGTDFSHTLIEELDGVWHKEPGSFIIGVIQNPYHWVRDDDAGEGPKTIYGVALRTTCEVICKDGRELFPLPAGSLVGVTVGAKLEQLLYMRPGNKVAIEAKKKVDIGGGKTVWEFFVRADAPRQSTRMVEALPQLPQPALAQLPI